MGHNDHLEDDRPELPSEAGSNTRTGFEPDDTWLATADEGLRNEAMRLWFVTRYWDPANDTPFNSQEGGYQWIHGGPYSAEDELYGRFGDQFSDEIIREVIDDIESDGLYEWAPIHTEPDYDAEFDFQPDARSDPYRFFRQRMWEIDELIAGAIDVRLQPFMRQLLYSSLIAALEAYLADTLSYWVAADKEVFRKFVSSCEEFKQKKLTLAEIFERMNSLIEEVEKYLGQLVWHRLDKVSPLMTDSLGIVLPQIDRLMKQIVVRHDLVHRGGKTRGGKTVAITGDDLSELRGCVIAFVDEIETALAKRFPIDVSGLVGDEFAGADS